jgi:hypothetical protein
VGRLYGVWDGTWNLERRVTIQTDRTLEALAKLAKAQ